MADGDIAVNPGRDPLADPQVGDQVRKGRQLRRVVGSLSGSIRYITKQFDDPRVTDLKEWCKWSKGAKVLR